jgi:PPOX class probable F420-dependent enzyme
MSPITMTRAEREAFLADTHVGIVSIAEPGRGPLAVPVWYRYAPGDAVRFATGANSQKARLLRAAGRAGFCVQTETAPYQYVSVEGPISIGKPDHERDIRELAIRYLGREQGEAYLQMMGAELDPAANVVVILTPERWYSVDYRKLG